MSLPAVTFRHRISRAFSLVEVIVVVGIVGLLAALLLPAIQQAREAARRVQCLSNLRQLGAALQSYYADHDMFPPSQLRTSPRASFSSFSEASMLLAYLGEQPLYSSINFNFAASEWAGSPSLENHTCRRTTLSVFLCPSDGEPNHRNSYRFNRGRMGGRGPGTGADGPFNIRVLPSQATVTDGLSRTAFVSERSGGSFYRGSEDPNRDVKLGAASSVVFASDAQFIPFCLDSQSQWNETAGRYWLYGGNLETHYNHDGLPNDPRPTCLATMAQDNGFGLNPPRSFHPGIVNVLFGDGHVEDVSNSIDERTWSALGTHASGD